MAEVTFMDWLSLAVSVITVIIAIIAIRMQKNDNSETPEIVINTDGQPTVQENFTIAVGDERSDLHPFFYDCRDQNF